MIWSKHLSRSHKWLKNLHAMHNMEMNNKVSSSKRISRTAASVDGSGRNNLEAHKKNESYKNVVNKYKNYLHIQNGSIIIPAAFFRECLCAHNYKRRLHDAPRLQWSAELAKEAQNRADKLASIGVASESEIAKTDENVYVDNIVDVSTACPRAVEFWYAESKNYNYTQNDLSKGTGLLN